VATVTQADEFSVANREGDLAVASGRYADAAHHFARASAVQPGNPAALFKWSRACFDAGRLDEAESLLDRAAMIAPNHEAILRLQAQIHARRADWTALMRTAGAWTTVNPRNPEAWRALAQAEIETGYLRQAIRSFRRSIDLGAGDAASLAIFARLCLTAIEYEQASAALIAAEQAGPPSAGLLTTRAALAMYSGHAAEAQAYSRRAIALDPSDATAWSLLAQAARSRLPEPEMAAIASLAERSDLPPDSRIKLAFAHAECRNAAGDESAFAEWTRANALCAERSAAAGFGYDPADRARQVDELIRLFPSIAPGKPVSERPRPVFIVGMPRSGTTLVESVIGAHPDAFACGERPAMRFIMQEFLPMARTRGMAAIPESAFARWREYYLTDLPAIGEATVVTDKNPWNFDAVGLILRLLPEARIIHLRRNPVDTGFSIWRNEFSKFMGFAHRLEDIAHYYSEYARLMEHWQRVAGGRVTTIRYEEFVRNFDRAGPALLAACGLGWRESCREFWKCGRVINSMSALQVREPLSAGTSRSWRYARELRPLAAALRQHGIDPETGNRLP
jgi:tetratricopeptide (TPR) repeat protein